MSLTYDPDPDAAFYEIVTRVAIAQFVGGRPILTPDTAPEILAEPIRHVLFQFGDLQHGHQPGSFTAILIELITRADRENILRLTGVFPVYTALTIIVRDEEGGMELLRRALKHKSTGESSQ